MLPVVIRHVADRAGNWRPHLDKKFWDRHVLLHRSLLRDDESRHKEQKREACDDDLTIWSCVETP